MIAHGEIGLLAFAIVVGLLLLVLPFVALLLHILESLTKKE